MFVDIQLLLDKYNIVVYYSLIIVYHWIDRGKRKTKQEPFKYKGGSVFLHYSSDGLKRNLLYIVSSVHY